MHWEVIVVDNGSSDDTAGWLHFDFPQVRVEVSAGALSFARAVNRGIRLARYSHVCLLNNDMLLERGFFLRCSGPSIACRIYSAPPRRSASRKASAAKRPARQLWRRTAPRTFPLRCDEPLPGEDLTWVLYGSGGCSLYDTAKLAALGNIDEAYEPAYVEDLDIGYRAWQRGWPSVYVAGALVEHRHRATTSRYYTQEQLEEVLEVNYLRFLARAVAAPALFRRLWKQASERLCLRIDRAPARQALSQAWRIALEGGPLIDPVIAEESFLALTDGSVAVFPGEGRGPAEIRAVDRLEAPAPELLRNHSEIVVVRGSETSLAYRTARLLLRPAATS